MRSLLFRTIRGRLLALAIGVEVLMLTVMVGNSLRLLRNAMTDQARWHATQIAPVLNAALVAPLLQRDYATVQAIITESRATDGIDYLAVVDRNGKRVAASGWRDEQPLPPASTDIRSLFVGEIPRYDVAVPIMQLGQQLGTLHFGLNISPIIAARESLFNQSLVIAALELLLSAAILALIGFRLTRRLTTLTQASLQVAGGNLTPPSLPEGADDLGQLGAAFNAMSRAIGERVTELTAAKEEAVAAGMAKSVFLANMSHEIRTPMNAITGLGRLLAQTELTETQQDYLTKLNRSSRSLLRLLDDILDLSRVESGRLALEESDFSLRQSLERVISLTTGAACEKRLSLQMEISPATPDCLNGDPFRLEQILINLVGNAIKFTEQGAVCLAVRPADHPAAAADHGRVLLTFSVTDSGIGLSNDQIDQLFEPFTQQDSSTTRRYGGSGLGLSICKRLTELMGGTIGATGAPGKGSTFRVTIPLGRGDEGRMRQQRPAATVSAETLQQIRGARLLVAEDNRINQQIIGILLEQLGIAVTLVDTGCKAVAAVAQAREPFGGVLMDIQMPEMDGYEATRKIREQRSAAELPIIAMTAHAMAEDRRRCLDAGMNDHLTKPVDIDQLHGVLVRWLVPAGTGDLALPLPVAGDEAPPPENLPGLDVPTALARMNIPWARYREFVILFGREHRDDAALLRRHLEAGDRDAARIVAHTLKGVAGNLEARELSASAAALEAALKRGCPEEAALCLPTVTVHLATVLEGAALLGQEPPAVVNTSGPEPDPAALSAVLMELSRLLAARNLGALDLFEQVRPHLSRLVEPEVVTELIGCMEKLDFNGARESLGRSAAWLNTEEVI